MSYFEYLQKSIDYIEENIKQPITIEACAEVAGFSKYHFYRLFTLFVGVPLMEYNFSDVRIEKLDTMYVASSYVISDDPEAEVINFMTEWMEEIGGVGKIKWIYA